MPKPIQLRIPTPCHEHWSNMQPAEKGRHCAACRKTVVDFTAMSDAEIIRHLAQAGSNVCGRLASNQINRSLATLPPPKRNGWSGWRWLLAGLLITSNDQGHKRPSGPGIHEHRMPPKADNSEEVVLGMINMPLIADTERLNSALVENYITEMDSSGTIMGALSAIAIDSFCEPKDSIQGPPLLPTADSTIEPSKSFAFNGEVVITSNSRIDSVKQFVTDTLTAMHFAIKVDSIKQFLTDTLATLHLLPKKALSVYPNPALRGNAVHLSWRTEPGVYQVALYNTAGVLILERVLEVNSRAQVDSWEIPAGVAAGVYIIRAVQTGQIGGYTTKLVVE